MNQERLKLYRIDIKYVRNLAKIDDNVLSVSPQKNKSNRPFVGIIVINQKKKYCVPLSSPKVKHQNMKNDVDFTKIYDNNKLIGVLNFNNMIPVCDECLVPLSLKAEKSDTPDIRHYKNMAKKQLAWCQKNQDSIVKKANRLYRMITEGKANSYLKRRCCDFLRLEKVSWTKN